MAHKQGDGAAGDLNVLPSFDDETQSMSLDNIFKSDEFTVGTVTTNSSEDSSDCSLKLQRLDIQKQHLESGSLFVTSPRSFLLGNNECW